MTNTIINSNTTLLYKDRQLCVSYLHTVEMFNRYIKQVHQILYLFRRSGTFVVFQVTPSLFNPRERLSTDFTNKTFNVTMLSFVGTQVSGIWILAHTLVTFLFGCAVFK